MLNKIRDFLGFGPVVRPEVKPARPPSARLKPTIRPEVKPVRPEVRPVRPAIEPERPTPPVPQRPQIPLDIPPPFAVAVRTFIRQFDRHSQKPPASQLRAAEYSLGQDRAAYLTALAMVDGQLMRFVLPETRIMDPDAEMGLLRRLNDATYGDLETWKEAERADAKRRRQLEYAGKPVPAPLHVPASVQAALISEIAKAAARVTKGGAGGKSGGPAPAPEGIPQITEEPENSGSGGMKAAGKKRRDDEPEDGSSTPAAPAPRPPEDDREPESDGDQSPPKP